MRALRKTLEIERAQRKALSMQDNYTRQTAARLRTKLHLTFADVEMAAEDKAKAKVQLQASELLSLQKARKLHQVLVEHKVLRASVEDVNSALKEWIDAHNALEEELEALEVENVQLQRVAGKDAVSALRAIQEEARAALGSSSTPMHDQSQELAPREEVEAKTEEIKMEEVKKEGTIKPEGTQKEGNKKEGSKKQGTKKEKEPALEVVSTEAQNHPKPSKAELEGAVNAKELNGFTRLWRVISKL